MAADGSPGTPGVDPEVNDLVDAALTPVEPPSAATTVEVSAVEIDVDELGLPDESAEPSEPGVIATRPTGYVGADNFASVPRTPGASTPPDENGTSVSFIVLSTLVQIAGVVGRDLQELVESLSDEDARSLKTLLLEGRWPGNEEVTRQAIIHAMPILNPVYARRTGWTELDFRSMKNIFLKELDPPPPDAKKAKKKVDMPRNENLVKLAARLRKQPPPMPVSVPPSRK